MAVQVGDIVKFRATVTKDGPAWNLTGGTITYTFVRPNGTSFSAAGTIENGLQGVVSYTTKTTDINIAGEWSIFVKCVDASGEQLTSPSGYLFPVFGVQ